MSVGGTERASDRVLSLLRAKWMAKVFFFFHAEDGIRDRNVTGVQTCALPISCRTPVYRSWPPPQKIRNKKQPRPLALVGVKLRADQIVTPDRRNNGPAIIGLGEHVGGIARVQFEAVREIDVSAGGEPGEHGMIAARRELVPAHMRDLERGIVGLDRDDLARNPAEPIDDPEFKTAFGHQLHADADPEKRPPAGDHRLAQRLFQTGNGGDAAAAIGKGALPGQHNAIGGQNLLGPARHDDAIAKADVQGGALRGLRRRAQIAGPVIDDRDCHYRLPLSVPFVEGTAPARRGSISIACRNARASPLKQLSTMWWLFSP